MNNKTFFPLYIHISILFFSALIFAFALDISFIDDGLRHIAYAGNKEIMKNWQEVFPHSLFTSYDPWLAWHMLLEFLLKFVPYDSIHIAINTLSLFFFMLLMHEHIKNEMKYDFASLIYLIVFMMVIFTAYRYFIARPDLLSGLFVMYALLSKNRFLPIFILTILYAPFYYLFFIYTGSIGLVYMVQKKWKAFSGVFLASLIVGIGFLLHDLEGYIYTVTNILTDQTLRMGLEVGEGKPLFKIFAHMDYFVSMPLFFGLTGFLIYWKYDYFKNNALATFLLITTVLWVNQLRYYYLFLPLIKIFMFALVVNVNKKRALYLIRKYYVIGKRYFSYAKKVPLFYIIAVPYAAIMFAVYLNTLSLNKLVEEAKFYGNSEFDHKRVLLNKMSRDIYKGLYYNPTIKFIPSCSVGWFENKDPKMKDIYVRMQKEEGISEEELAKLIKYTNTDIYIHYLLHEKQVLNFDKLKELGIIAQTIYQNRIIFTIKK